jgi:hypothetical protein
MDTKESIETIGLRRVEPRYISINEDIYEALNVYERSVYEALRFEADYSKEVSIVKRSIAFIVEKSKLSRRKVFQCLSSLETIHFLIQRIELPITGIQNNYNVARTLNFFNPALTSAPHALVDKNCTCLCGASAPHALPSAPHALLISNSYIKEEIKDITPVADAPVLKNISDYVYPETYFPLCEIPDPEKHIELEITKAKNSFAELIKDNPHCIPIELLKEWKQVRRKPITPTVWRKLNEEISKCKCSPIEAVEEMISRGWGTLRAEWINKNFVKEKESQETFFDHKNTDWIFAPRGIL